MLRKARLLDLLEIGEGWTGKIVTSGLTARLIRESPRRLSQFTAVSGWFIYFTRASG
jgi:hypothetical protein